MFIIWSTRATRQKFSKVLVKVPENPEIVELVYEKRTIQPNIPVIPERKSNKTEISKNIF